MHDNKEDEYCDIGDINSIPNLSDYSNISGYLMNYTLLNNLVSIMRENNIKYIKAWCCMYTKDNIGITNKMLNKLKPKQLILYVKNSTILNVYDVKNNKAILLYDSGDLLFTNKLFICCDEKACIDNYNQQVFECIKTLKKEINHFKKEIEEFSKLIIESEQQFIDTDIIIETLKNLNDEI